MNKDNPFISVAEIDEQIAKAQKDTGGPAFPQTQVDYGNGPEDPGPFGMGGMTLRDYFAAHALTGLCSAQNANGVWQGDVPEAAEKAYFLADAMIAERGKA
ncbi:MAG: hypothetical protein WC854_14265 [Bacteroidales bacterium]